MKRLLELLLIVSLFAAAAERDAAARTMQQIRSTGTLRVGVALYVPWAARAPNGDLIGFEVDVANRLAADMGLKAEILPYEFGRLIPALESGEIDLIAAGLSITPERALHVNFSDPYADGGIGLATHTEHTSSVTRLEDLDTERVTIAAVQGSVAADLAARVLPHAKVKTFKDVSSASAALVAGDVDGYLEDEPVPTFLSLENPGKVDVPLDKPLLRSREAFAVNKGDPDFVFFLNAWIVAREADTWLPTTTAYWFKSTAWKDRLNATTRR